MRIIKTLIAVAALFAGLTANAQTSAADLEAQELGYKPYPHWFIQVQGGVGTTFTNRKFTDLISPTASVGFGRWFAPAIGARLHLRGPARERLSLQHPRGGRRTGDDLRAGDGARRAPPALRPAEGSDPGLPRHELRV